MDRTINFEGTLGNIIAMLIAQLVNMAAIFCIIFDMPVWIKVICAIFMIASACLYWVYEYYMVKEYLENRDQERFEAYNELIRSQELDPFWTDEEYQDWIDRFS